MPYTLPRTEGRQSIIVSDTSIDTTTSLGFIGQGQTNYGEQTALNFLRLLENFSNGIEPITPITGQLWFDTSSTTLKINKTVNDGLPDWQEIGGAGDVTQIEFQVVVDEIGDIEITLGDFIDSDGNFVQAFSGFGNVGVVNNLFDVLEDLDDAISLAAGGGASKLSDLTDVDTAGKLDEYILIYNSGADEWQPGPAPAGGGGGAGNLWGADGGIKVGNFFSTWNENYLVNTTSTSAAAALPAGATEHIGKTIGFVDVAGTFNTNVFAADPAPGDKMMGVTDDVLWVTTQFASLRLVWAGSAFGWRLVT